MRSFVLSALVLLVSLAAFAGEWGQSWISHPAVDSTEQVLFRREIVLEEKPTAAVVAVASAGRYALYVNGYNVVTDVLEPGVPLGGDTVAVTHYEVARYLRKGGNALAVWYSPAGRCGRSERQLSLSFQCNGGDFHSNRGENGCGYACATDSMWLCRASGCRTFADGSELIDSRTFDPSWTIDPTFAPEWLPAREETPALSVPVSDTRKLWRTALRVESIQPNTFFSTIEPYDVDQTGRNTGRYTFKKGFDGWVRLTLRGMESGDTVTVNGLTYICSGDTDEQACRRFTTSSSCFADVTLPAKRPFSCVTTVEALDIRKYFRTSCQY